MSSRTTRSQTRRNLAVLEAASSEPPLEVASQPPAKRAKTTKDSKKVIPAKNSRKKGRLSVLPSLPLDVLFEVCHSSIAIDAVLITAIQIFAHLGPADLLHLSRTTRAFRNVLLSRQYLFLWRTVCDAVDEFERFPCPDDVSLPVWVNLAYGGPWCDVRPETKRSVLELMHS